jgi:nicotinamidase-related amidase
MATSSIVLPGRFYRSYPVDEPLGHTVEHLDIELRRTVFLAVDVYGQGFDGDNAPTDLPEMYQKASRDNRDIVRDHIVPAKDAARRLGLPIVYLTNYLSPTLNEHSEWRNLSLRVHGIDVLEAWKEPNDILRFSKIVAPNEGEYVVKKQLYSGFFETHLDSLLRSLDAYNLVTVGFDSRICLGTTVLDAMYRNYRVIVLRDAIGTAEEIGTAPDYGTNQMAVRFIETNVGYTCTSKEWITACTERLNSCGINRDESRKR